MRVHVVSDVHGAVDALAKAGEGADALVCLGDLLLFIDYRDPGGGIFGRLFGADATRELLRLRKAGQMAEARRFSARLWAGAGSDPTAVMEEAVVEQYQEIFAVLPVPTYLTYGNVDLPRLWPRFLRDGLTVLDGESIDIGGWRFGFVGGSLRSYRGGTHELDDEDYAAKIDALGEVDVLCCHIPPAVPELTYDVVAQRHERGSEAALDLIRRSQPQFSLFGHVHQPQSARVRIGRTECVNVGHFRATGRPFVLEY